MQDYQDIPDIQEPNEVNEDILDIKEPNEVNEDIPDIKEPNEVNEDISGIQEPNEVNEDIPDIKEPNEVNEDIPDIKEPKEVNEDIPDIKEPNEVNEDISDIQEPNEVNEDIPDIKEPKEVNEDIPDIKEPKEVNEDIPDIKEPKEVNEDISDIQEPKEVNEYIPDIQEPNEINEDNQNNQVNEDISNIQEPKEVNEDNQNNQVNEDISNIQEPKEINEDNQNNQVNEDISNIQEPKEINEDNQNNQVNEDISNIQEPNEVNEDISDIQEPKEVNEDNQNNQVNEDISNIQEPKEINEDNQNNQVNEDISDIQEPKEVNEDNQNNQVNEDISNIQEPNEVNEDISDIQEPKEVNEYIPDIQEPNEINEDNQNNQVNEDISNIQEPKEINEDNQNNQVNEDISNIQEPKEVNEDISDIQEPKEVNEDNQNNQVNEDISNIQEPKEINEDNQNNQVNEDISNIQEPNEVNEDISDIQEPKEVNEDISDIQEPKEVNEYIPDIQEPNEINEDNQNNQVNEDISNIQEPNEVNEDISDIQEPNEINENNQNSQINEDNIQQIIMIDLDRSGSMLADIDGYQIDNKNENQIHRMTIAFQYISNFANSIYNYRIPSIQGLVSFDRHSKIHSPLRFLESNITDQTYKIEVTPKSRTKLWDSLDFCCDEIVKFRKDKDGNEKFANAQSRILFISDGEDIHSTVTVEEVVKKLIKNNIIVDSIILNTYGKEVKRLKLLSAVCHATGGISFKVESDKFTNLNSQNANYVPSGVKKAFSFFEKTAFLNIKERRLYSKELIPSNPKSRPSRLKDKPELITEQFMIEAQKYANFDSDVQSIDNAILENAIRFETPRHVLSMNKKVESYSNRQRRILHELFFAAKANSQLTQQDNQDMKIYTIKGRCDKWSVFLKGSAESPYENKWWQLLVTFPENYPFSPPAFKFISIPYHINVSTDGHVCLNNTGLGYRPTMRVAEILHEIKDIFLKPCEESFIQLEIYDKYRNNQTEYIELAKKSSEVNAKDTIENYFSSNTTFDDDVSDMFEKEFNDNIPFPTSRKPINPENIILASSGVYYDREELRQLVKSSKNPICIITGKPLTETIDDL